jgi:tetratricopeptide (TPR) repeat protein
MMSAVTLIALLVSGAAPKSPAVPKVEGTRLEQGQKLFTLGEFDAALRALDAAALDGGDNVTLEKVHLLRAQCFAARQDFARAEEAFALALDANPDATLDPSRVDPTLVKLLDAVRARLTGLLVVGSTPAGAALSMDGKVVGVAPLTLQVPVGKHHLEARWGDATMSSTDVKLRPRREMRVEWVQAAPQMVAVHDVPDPRKIGPYGDFRFAPEVSSRAGIDVAYPLELGGGFEFSYFRAGLAVRLFPDLGVIPRFAFSLPVMEQINVTLELSVPVIFFTTPAVGISGAAGIEFYPVKWIGAYALVGGRYFFFGHGNDTTAFVPTFGVRLRVP